MQDFQLLNIYLVVGSLLFSIGVVGIVARRGLVYVVLSSSIMMQGVFVAAIGCGAFHGNSVGQIITLFGLSVSVIQTVIAAALFRGTLASRGDGKSALGRSHNAPQPSTRLSTEQEPGGVIDA